jgi:hypothetical protein
MKTYYGVILLFIISLCFSVNSFSQEIVNENNPPSLKWYQINTPHFRVLFPKGFDAQAQRMANTLEYIHEPESKTMGASPRKISVVLQNQSSISNGFVSITPRRSEFYAMPSQNYNFLGNNDWLNLLATHEYRHMVQFQHATRGFNRLLYYAFGNNVLAGMSYVAAPQWFWEGDAVATETAFTQSGRGRIPNFDLVFRTNLMEGRTFNYHKQYLRSYKHNIPDHYKLGYHMVSYLRRKTNNPDVWENITRRSWNVPFIPFTFSNSIKKETGLYVNGLYREMAADLKKQWQAQLDTTVLTSFEKINPRTTRAYTDYRFPQELEDGSILAQKSGIGDIETLVTIKNGVEKKVYVQGIINDAAMLSATNSRVVWNEFRFDPRWRIKNYSAIVGYDLGSKTKRVIATKGRYAAAAISLDGYQVATVETKTDYQTKLVVLDYISGKVIREFDNPSNDFISMPRFTQDGKEIVALKTNKQGKAMARFNVESGSEKNITDFTDENVGHPVPHGKYVLYNSPISGIDNIYSLDTETNQRYQITSSKYASYNPCVSRDGKTIYYNEQGKDGLDIVKIAFDPSTWKVWTRKTQPSTFFNHLVEQEGMPNLLSNIPTDTLKVKRYSKLKGIINPYSWGTYFSNSLSQANVGISSRDLLSTTTINAGYSYDITERTGNWVAGVSYQALFPIIDVQVTSGERELKTGVFGRDVKFKWNEAGLKAGLRVPLVLTRSKYFSEIEIGNSFGLTKTSSFSNEISENGNVISTGTSRFVPANDSLFFGFNDRVGNGQLRYNQILLSFTNSLKTSRRDFNPQYAQFLVFENYATPYGGDFQGSLTAIRSSLYFPSLLRLFAPNHFKHHSMYFRFGYQTSYNSTNLNVYQFRNRIFKPRGYSYPRDNEFVMFSANYTFPIHIDFAFGPILNIQRIKINSFTDLGSGKGKSYYYQPISNQNTRVYVSDNSANYISFGAEITFDVNIMRFLPQFELGVRATYINANRFNSSGAVVEFILGNIPF